MKRPQRRHSTFSTAPAGPKLTVTSTTRKSWKPNRQRRRRKMFIIVQLGMKRRISKTGIECDRRCCYEIPLNTAPCCLPMYERGRRTGRRRQKAKEGPDDPKSSDRCAPYELASSWPDHAAEKRPLQRGGAQSVTARRVTHPSLAVGPAPFGQSVPAVHPH